MKLYESMHELSAHYPISAICVALSASRTSYMNWLSHRADDCARVSMYCRIVEIYSLSNGVYGAPKIRVLLERNYGITVSVSTVSRAMHAIGIISISKSRFPARKSSIRANERHMIVNILRGMEICRINQAWTTDITYIKTISEGTFFLISFIDSFSRRVLSWGLYPDQKTERILEVLENAMKSRCPAPGLVVHSDKGAQMRSRAYREFLSRHRLVPSYTSLDHSCDENAAQESFHSLLKKEHLYQMRIYSFEDAYREIFNYIEGFYNPIRIHSSIGYLSPIQFENRIIEQNTP